MNPEVACQTDKDPLESDKSADNQGINNEKDNEKNTQNPSSESTLDNPLTKEKSEHMTNRTSEIDLVDKLSDLLNKSHVSNMCHSKSNSPTDIKEIVPFSRENKMLWPNWLHYFDAICISEGKDAVWKIQHIQKYLQGSALTLYINSCLNVMHWDELVDIFNEAFIEPGQIQLSDFTALKFKIGESVNEYYQQKVKLGRDLGLDNRFIIDGLTEGLPRELKLLVVANAPKTIPEWRELAFKLNKLQLSTPPENRNVQTPQYFRQFRPQGAGEYSLNPQARPFNYRMPYQYPQQRQFTPNQDKNQTRINRPFVNPIRNPNIHYQERLPPTPCRICLNYNITNAYHWMRQCPFNNQPVAGVRSPLQFPNNPFLDTPIEEQAQGSSESTGNN